MSLYLPFGIALFHASNSQFLYVAKTQRRYADAPPNLSKPDSNTCNRRDKTALGRFRKLGYTKKMLTVVCTGMLIQASDVGSSSEPCWTIADIWDPQLLLTVTMYLVSRKYHPWFGVPGTAVKGAPMQQKVEMGRGWEWWPSVFWQVFWAWLVAPVILWKSRGIKDTQGWRIQTIACCIASLHATPMWLIALYVPEMAPVNRYFIPPQWICLSITFIEIFAVFIPCWQTFKHQSLQQYILESIANWEARNKARDRSNSIFTGSTKVASSTAATFKSFAKLENGDHPEDIFTMGALEYVLERNPEPLRKFSALRDFSGENIVFLSVVGEWKNSFVQSPRSEQRQSELTRERFNRALRIYTEFISPYYAEFQINIASQDLKRLESIFEHAARILYGDKTERFTDPVVPFEDPNWGPASPNGGSEIGRVPQHLGRSPIADRVQYWGEIPEAFTANVFDEAETSVKYLVLTNTWPKFVKERRYSLDSEDSGETADTYHSISRLSRVARYFRTTKTVV